MAEQEKPKEEQKQERVGQRMAATNKAPILALQPRNFEELWNFAKLISETDFVPGALRGKPGAIIACVQYGAEVGLPPMTSLRWIAVINNVPSIWGDGYWMLLKSHPLCEWTKELSSEEALAKGYGECTIKRKGDPEPTTRRFTVDMAEKAGLWGGKGGDQTKKEQSAWFKYPGRMLQMRARSLCGRDTIPESIGPLSMREEAEDFDIETTATEIQEEPLKIPQAVKEEGDGQQTTNPSDPISDGVPINHIPAELPRGQKVGASTEKSPKKQKEPTIEERVADLEDWLQNRATREEILALDNYLGKGMKGLPSKVQVALCTKWNERRRQLQTEKPNERKA